MATCDQCGDDQPSTTDRNNGMRECDPCWRESLRHGHLHGMHQDMDGQREAVPGCPGCPTIGPDDLMVCPFCSARLLYWQWGDHQRDVCPRHYVGTANRRPACDGYKRDVPRAERTTLDRDAVRCPDCAELMEAEV